MNKFELLLETLVDFQWDGDTDEDANAYDIAHRAVIDYEDALRGELKAAIIDRDMWRKDVENMRAKMANQPGAQPAKATPIHWKQKLNEYREIAVALGTPVPNLFSKKSQALYRARASELGADWWDRAMVELRQVNAFCKGDNERGWRINLKYVLSPDGCEKLLDGEWRTVEEGPSESEGSTSIDDLFPEGG